MRAYRAVEKKKNDPHSRTKGRGSERFGSCVEWFGYVVVDVNRLLPLFFA